MILSDVFTSQPGYAASIVTNDPLAYGLQIAWTPNQRTKRPAGAAWKYDKNGVGASNNTDNSYQLPACIPFQNADLTTTAALLYMSGARDGVNDTRIFGTRGTTGGSSNRRGWEFGLVTGSTTGIIAQVFDSGSGRHGFTANPPYLFASAGINQGDTVLVVAEIKRSGSDTVGTFWGRAIASASTTTSNENTCTITSTGFLYGNDTGFNVPEVSGLSAGQSSIANIDILGIYGWTRSLAPAEREALYRNFWRLYARPNAVMTKFGTTGPTIIHKPPVRVQLQAVQRSIT